MDTKKCRICGVDKPVSEFRASDRNKDGLHSYCRPCQNAYKYAHAKKMGHKYVKAYAARNRQRWNDYGREWRRRYPEKARALSQRKSAKRRGATTGTHGLKDIEFLMLSQRGLCPICRCPIAKNFHVDHVMPIALGGSNDRTNIQLLCPPCNRKKGAKHPITFMQQSGLLL